MQTEYSVQSMVSDGTLSTIALGIQYLQRDDIYIRINGEETPQSGSDYTWSFLDNTTLRITPVVPVGVEVVVYRRTDVDAMYNVYSQGAQFDESTIDENNTQLLYIAQEYLEQGATVGVDTIEFLRDDGYYSYYRIKRTDGSYTDEFAVPSAGNSTKVLARESLRRSYALDGLTLVAGSFERGGTLTSATDVLLYDAMGGAYSWGGAFPKVVPADSTPDSTGGIGEGKWVSRFDPVLNATAVTFKNEFGYSAVDNMIAGRVNGIAGAVVHRVGNIYSTGGTTWEVRTVSDPMTLADFTAYEGKVFADDWGADNTGAQDSWQAIQDAIDTTYAVHLSAGSYTITKPLEAEVMKLHGVGIGTSLTPANLKTIIVKTTHELGSDITRDGISYQVDSIISILHPANQYAQGTHISNIFLVGVGASDYNRYGIYNPRSSRGKFEWLQINNCDSAFWAQSLWDSVMERVYCFRVTTGIDLVGGSGGSTSLTMNNVSAQYCTTGFNLTFVQYSTLTNCYCENGDGTLFSIINSSNITLSSCGGEQPKGRLLNLSNSRVTVDSWQSGTLTPTEGVDAVRVNDSTLTLINSTMQTFNAPTSNKSMIITGVGIPSYVKLINSTLAGGGGDVSVDGLSYYEDDKRGGKSRLRGKRTTSASVVTSTIPLSLVANTGSVTSSGTITGTFMQINNFIHFSITIDGVVVNAASTGSVIFSVPFTLTNTAYAAAHGANASGSCFHYQPTQMRISIPVPEIGTSRWVTSGVMEVAGSTLPS